MREKISKGFHPKSTQMLSSGKKLVVAPMDGKLYLKFYEFCQKHDLDMDSAFEVFFSSYLPKFLDQLGSELEQAKQEFRCSICGKIFPSKPAWAGHMAVHRKKS